MLGAVLVGVLALVAGGCVCVIWADRGGPRWVRTVAAVTVALGEALRQLEKGNRRRGITKAGDSGGGDS
ncbi:hypothetical protein [Kitasatospora terrestris]|uniref:Uncharacterized protein n=1 Tax=Kitasatospora terrestris TaxID=258051 RepID=A0ABP9DAR3_9ACTN